MIHFRNRGFTLIEVLVALVVATLALGAVLAAVSQMADTGLTLRERTYASWIGQNKITELRLANVIPDVSESNGEIEYAGQEWAWIANISETGIENLFRVDVDISRPGSDDIIRSVIGFIGEPSALGESNRAWSVGGQVSGATN
ncbi:MAG: type II secretion system minor pseudopilin GspI [Woeseiaceae bacterium]|nr:type II secretion system minor pseudopilin GspI [Woeseiaceae bacterium]|tara:strand:- start:183 stop:614 length:432 start_codon:yes stop_codon:yes gene_type:complete